MAEWSKALVLKTRIGNYREFKPHSILKKEIVAEWFNATDCKSVTLGCHQFESDLFQVLRYQIFCLLLLYNLEHIYIL